MHAEGQATEAEERKRERKNDKEKNIYEKDEQTKIMHARQRMRIESNIKIAAMASC